METMPFGFSIQPGRESVDPIHMTGTISDADGLTTTLESLVGKTEATEGVLVRALEAGTRLTVKTVHSCYDLIVLDGPDQRVLVTGGTRFAQRCGARVEGATAGGTALQGGWIRVGLRMEMNDGVRRITTSPVRSIEVAS